MLQRHPIRLAAALGAAVGMLAIAAGPARAIGYYNLPGSFDQCFGYGNGAGHHACLVLGPAGSRGCGRTHNIRLEHSPQPSYGYYGSGQCDAMPCGDISRGTWLEGPAAAPSAMRPQILR